MTAELWYLFLTSILLAVMWIPTIVGQTKTAGPLSAEEYRTGRNVEFPHWVNRANRAHLNLVEQFGAFIGLVVVAHSAGISNWAGHMRGGFLLGPCCPCNYPHFRDRLPQGADLSIYDSFPVAACFRLADFC
jgi:MAPEG family